MNTRKPLPSEFAMLTTNMLREPNFYEEMPGHVKEKNQFFAQHTNPVNQLPFRRVDQSLPALFKEDEKNAGFDLFARLDEPVTLAPGEVAIIPLNVVTRIPMSAVGFLFQRSSTFRKWGVRLTNSVGVIDASFAGNEDEWAAEFQNMKDHAVTISRGDKVCQALFLSLLPVKLVEEAEFDGPNRGGFGTSFDNAEDLG